MATATSNSLSLPSSSPLIDTPRQPASASPQCVTLPTLPPPPLSSLSRVGKTTAYCRKFARNVIAMATGDVPAAMTTTTEASAEVASTEMPEVVKTIQAAWDKVEDKYAVSSLAVAGVVALWGSTGMISAIDRLPLVPGALELVGIGYTGWFAYKNLIFKPDRQALVGKIKELYGEITGSS